jgi:hypothetical protein
LQEVVTSVLRTLGANEPNMSENSAKEQQAKGKDLAQALSQDIPCAQVWDTRAHFWALGRIGERMLRWPTSTADSTAIT